MAEVSDVADDLTRLRAVQARVRSLAQRHDWFAEAIRSAFTDYLALSDRHIKAKNEQHNAERRLARNLLARGLLVDPAIRGNAPCLMVDVGGLCPAGLAERLQRFGSSKPAPPELAREAAAVALAALDRDIQYQSRAMRARKKKKMAGEFRARIRGKDDVDFRWRILVARPAIWTRPANPHTLDRRDLERFTDDEYRTIALYRLGGLADCGRVRPIVPKPLSTGNIVKDCGAYAAWRARFPAVWSEHDAPQPPLNPAAFPPDVAEQMLSDAEAYFASRPADSLAPPSANGATGVAPLGTNKKLSRRKRATFRRSVRALTAIERRTLEVVGKHGGNFTKAARELGRKPKTVRENFHRAQAKVAQMTSGRSVSATKLPTDRRGQEVVADDSDD